MIYGTRGIRRHGRNDHADYIGSNQVWLAGLSACGADGNRRGCMVRGGEYGW